MDKKFLKKVIAQSPSDLQYISACCSEAKTKIKDIKYLPKNKLFLISIALVSKSSLTESGYKILVILAVAIKTLFTIIGLQFLGKKFFKLTVVIQKRAFVFDARLKYFFEWKKVISLDVEVDKSLILQEREGFESPILLPGHKTVATFYLYRFSCFGEG